jgi:hypothetical protein
LSEILVITKGGKEMDKTLLSLIIFIMLSIINAFLFHRQVTNYFVACIAASIVTVLIYQIMGIIITGYLDPFFVYGLITEIVLSFIITIIIGIPFLYLRFKNKEEKRSN